MRNRSDDEAFDLYFDGDKPIWRWLYWYGIITGIFWIVVASSNLIVLFWPRLADTNGWFARPTEAVLESFNPKYWKIIRLEAAAAILLHVGLVVTLGIPLLNYFLMMFGFGFMWSAMQYVHHFATVRDVREGARNLRTFAAIDLIWLNHNYHLNHHLRPTVPWIHLPRLFNGDQFARSSLLLAYLRMWRGPRLTDERVENRFSGKIIK
jgi:fatty acid desaturase